MSYAVSKTTEADVRPGRRPLSEWAAQRLREDIFTGVLSPDTPISEDEVRLRLGVSRSPAREALRELEVQGLLVVNAVSGRRLVAKFDRADIFNLYTVRSALEELASEHAARNAGHESVAYLTLLQDKIELTSFGQESPDRQDFEIDLDLHREIAQAARMPHLIRALDPFWAQTQIVLRTLFHAGVYTDPDEGRAAYQDHRAIINAIARRDAPEAAAATRQHLHRRRDVLIAAIDAREAKQQGKEFTEPPASEPQTAS